MPGVLGSPAFWVAASGFAELVCAAGLVRRRTRRSAAWAAVALFVVVFPANITMAVHAAQGDGSKLIAYARLPVQIPLVLSARWIARGATDAGRAGRAPSQWPW